MGANSIMQPWDELEGKVKTKLVQLTGLLQHLITSTDTDSDVYYQNLASQHDTEIEDILQETVGRIQTFRDAMELHIREDDSKAAAEALLKQREMIQLAAENEFSAYKKKAKEREEALEDSHRKQMELVYRELDCMKETMDKESYELERALAKVIQISNELEATKRNHAEELNIERAQQKREVRELSEKHEKEIQAHNDHEVEELKKQEASHQHTIEQVRAYYKEEINRLKLESEEKLIKLQQSYDSLQYDLTSEKLSIQDRLTTVYKEREALAKETALLKGDLREANSLLESTKSDLQQTKSSLEEDIAVLKEDNIHLEERLQGALGEISRLSSEKENADVEKDASVATLAETGDMMLSLKWELEKMTTTCRRREETISSNNCKIEQLQSSLTKTQKELDAALAELDKEMYRVAVKDDQLQDLESKRKSLSGEISRMRSLVSKKEESMQILELKLHAQSSEHEMKLKTLEEDFLQMNEDGKKKHRKEMKVLQSRLEEKQVKHMSHLNIYQKRVDQLEAQLQALKVLGEDKLKSLDSQARDHEEHLKRVCVELETKLKNSQRECTQLEHSLKIVNEEFQSRHRGQQAEIEKLKQTIVETELSQKHIQAAAYEDYLAKLQEHEREWSKRVEQERECAEKGIQKLKETHATATKVALYDHQMALSTLKAMLDEQKTQEIQMLRDSYQKQIAKLEFELKELSSEYEKLKLEHKAVLDIAAQKQNALVSAHQHALESQMTIAENELARFKEAHARELSIALSQSTQKAVMESLTLHEDHKKRLERLSEVHKSELQKLQALHAKEMEKNKSNLSELLARISELETSNALKEKKLKELNEATQQLEKRTEASLKDSKLGHEKAFNFQRHKFSKDKEALAKHLEKKYRTELDLCNAFHTSQYETLQHDLNRSKALMRQKQAEITELQTEFDNLKERFESRESRLEDLHRIAELEQLCVGLQESCDKKDLAYQKLQEESKQIRMEMLNREENYNKIFRSSPVVQQGSVEWVKPRSPSRSAQSSRSAQGSRQGKI